MHNNKLSIDTRTHTLTQRAVRRDSCAVSVSAWAATAVAGAGTGDPGVYPLEQCGGSKHTYSEHSSVCNTAVEPGKVRLACRANNTIDTFPSVAVHTHTNTQDWHASHTKRSTHTLKAMTLCAPCSTTSALQERVPEVTVHDSGVRARPISPTTPHCVCGSVAYGAGPQGDTGVNCVNTVRGNGAVVSRQSLRGPCEHE